MPDPVGDPLLLPELNPLEPDGAQVVTTTVGARAQEWQREAINVLVQTEAVFVLDVHGQVSGVGQLVMVAVEKTVIVTRDFAEHVP